MKSNQIFWAAILGALVGGGIIYYFGTKDGKKVIKKLKKKLKKQENKVGMNLKEEMDKIESIVKESVHDAKMYLSKMSHKAEELSGGNQRNFQMGIEEARKLLKTKMSRSIDQQNITN